MCNDQCPCGKNQSIEGVNAGAVAGVDRRDFLTTSLLTAVAAVLAGSSTGCGTGLMGGDSITAPSSLANGLTVTLANFPALATVGGIARVDNQQAGTTPVAVVRTGSSTWAAFSMVCPHAGTTINVVSGGFLCPNHGARFNASGANIGGQSSGPLTTLSVTVRADGTLSIIGSAPAGGSAGGSEGSDD